MLQALKGGGRRRKQETQSVICERLAPIVFKSSFRMSVWVERSQKEIRNYRDSIESPHYNCRCVMFMLHKYMYIALYISILFFIQIDRN